MIRYWLAYLVLVALSLWPQGCAKAAPTAPPAPVLPDPCASAECLLARDACLPPACYPDPMPPGPR